MNEYTEREAFEAWAVGEGFKVERGSRGHYTSLGTNQLFSGWLGRAALSEVAPPAQAGEPTELTDEQIQAAVFALLRKWNDAGLWMRYTRETGPYDVTVLRASTLEICRAILAEGRKPQNTPTGDLTRAGST